MEDEVSHKRNGAMLKLVGIYIYKCYQYPYRLD